VFWLQPPPYARRAAAVALVLVALLWDLRGSATASYPFSASAIEAGAAFTDSNVEWRQLPEGSFPAPDLSGGSAAVPIGPGEPITASLVTGSVSVPEGWWAVPVDLASRAVPGTSVLLVVVEPPMTIPGIVVAAQRGDRYAVDHTPALVAVPGEMAPLVAAAERAGMLVTATRP